MHLSLVHPTAPPLDSSRATRELQRVAAASGSTDNVVVVHGGQITAFCAASLKELWSRSIDGLVHDVAVSPSSDRFLLARRSGVEVWDRDGMLERKDVSDVATAVAFAPDGGVVAGGGGASVWVEVAAGWGAFSVHQRRVKVVDRLGDVVLSGAADAQVVWTDLESGRAKLFQGHVGEVSGVKVLDENQALSASADGSVRCWTAKNGSAKWCVYPPTGPITAMAVHGDRVMVGGANGVVVVLSLEDGQELGVLLGHRRPVAALGFCSDGQRGWSVGQDRTLRSWYLEDAVALPPFIGHRGGVRACAFGTDFLWSGGRDGTVRSWNRATGSPEACWSVSASAVQALLAVDGGRWLVGSADGGLAVLSEAGARVWSQDSAHIGPVTCAVALSEGPVLTGGADGALRAWTREDGAPLWVSVWHETRLRCLAVSADGRVASGSYGGRVVVGEAFSAEPPVQWVLHDAPVVSVDWWEDCVLSASLDGSVVLSRDGRSVEQAVAHPSGVVGVRVLPTDVAVSIGRDGQVSLWQLPTLERLSDIELSVPLDGLAAERDCVLIGDRRGGLHLLRVEA